MNKRGHWTIIMILTILGLLIGFFSLYLQLHAPTDECDVLETVTHQNEANSPVCNGPTPDLNMAVATRCTAMGFNGFDARRATCTNRTLTYDCLRVTKTCS